MYFECHFCLSQTLYCCSLGDEQPWHHEVCYQYAYWHHFCHSSYSHYCFIVSVNHALLSVITYSHRCLSLKIKSQKCIKRSLCEERMHYPREMILRIFLISYITHVLIRPNNWQCNKRNTLWLPLTLSLVHSSTLVTWCETRQQQLRYSNQAYFNIILFGKLTFNQHFRNQWFL